MKDGKIQLVLLLLAMLFFFRLFSQDKSECLSIGEYDAHTKNKEIYTRILKCADSAEKYRLLTIAYFKEGKLESNKEKAREFFIKARQAFLSYEKLKSPANLFVYMIALENSILLDFEKDAYVIQEFITEKWPNIPEVYYLYANYIVGSTNSRIYSKTPKCNLGGDYFNKAFLLNQNLKAPKFFNKQCGVWKKPK